MVSLSDTSPVNVIGVTGMLKDKPGFEVDFLSRNSGGDKMEQLDRSDVIMPVKGHWKLIYDEGSLTLNPGDTVSVPSGVQSAAKYLAKEYDFINKFCRSVICFDNDKAGEVGSEKALKVLPKGKAAIARLPEDINDVNDLTVAKRGDELKDILWKAQPCRTDHIINAADAWELFSKETSKPICDYPYPELNKFTGGLFPTQMVSIAAGSVAGKSTLC